MHYLCPVTFDILPELPICSTVEERLFLMVCNSLNGGGRIGAPKSSLFIAVLCGFGSQRAFAIAENLLAKNLITLCEYSESGADIFFDVGSEGYLQALCSSFCIGG